MNTARCVSRSISRRVREIVDCSGCGLLEAQAQKAAQRERVGGAPRDAALRINPFDVADQQQPEIRARRQTRAADRCGVKHDTSGFDELVETVRVQDVIQPLIERMPARRGQLVRGNPQFRRACPLSASTHGHAGV